MAPWVGVGTWVYSPLSAGTPRGLCFKRPHPVFPPRRCPMPQPPHFASRVSHALRPLLVCHSGLASHPFYISKAPCCRIGRSEVSWLPAPISLPLIAKGFLGISQRILFMLVMSCRSGLHLKITRGVGGGGPDVSLCSVTAESLRRQVGLGEGELLRH